MTFFDLFVKKKNFYKKILKLVKILKIFKILILILKILKISTCIDIVIDIASWRNFDIGIDIDIEKDIQEILLLILKPKY